MFMTAKTLYSRQLVHKINKAMNKNILKNIAEQVIPKYIL